MTTVTISGPLEGLDRERALALLRSEGYAHDVMDADRVFAAWLDADVVGVVRLAAEHGVTVLRGMRVRGDMQRRGVGRQLLARLDRELGESACYCIPYAWLTGFYGQIGFEVVDSAGAPAFLAERLATYSPRVDVVLMKRPRSVVTKPI